MRAVTEPWDIEFGKDEAELFQVAIPFPDLDSKRGHGLEVGKGDAKAVAYDGNEKGEDDNGDPESEPSTEECRADVGGEGIEIPTVHQRQRFDGQHIAGQDEEDGDGEMASGCESANVREGTKVVGSIGSPSSLKFSLEKLRFVSPQYMMMEVYDEGSEASESV